MPRHMLRTCLQAGRIEAGCDEAGRGPLAGPVAAAAVILPEGWNHPLLNDSKKMSEKNRYLLRETIEREAVAWAVEMVSPEEIDRINILNASFAAMSRAVARLKVVPQMLLIDGNRFRTSTFRTSASSKATRHSFRSPPPRFWQKLTGTTT